MFARTERSSQFRWAVLLPAVVLLACSVFATQAFAEPKFPQLSGRVVDAANILPPDVEARLNDELAGLETQNGRQLVVATLPDLQGYDIADYGYQLGRAWGLGQKQLNNGVILLVALKERRVRIEVGYGLEPILTDGLSKIIIESEVVPRFRQNDLPGGVVAGTAALIRQLSLDKGEAQARAQAGDEAAKQANEGSAIGPAGLFPLLIFGIWALMAFGGHGHGRRHRHGSGLPMILWGPGPGGHGGGGFRGGFRGGGGSFGGGGASGGW